MKLTAFVCLALLGLCGACGDDVSREGATLPEAGPRPSFADGPDASAGCSIDGPGACDLVTGCGCPSGDTCRIDATQPGAGACAPLASNPLPPYGVCSSGADCPALHSCVGLVCKQQCRDPEDCGWENARCIAASDSDESTPPAGYCTRECDVASPATPDPGFQPCAPGVHCIVTGDGTDCAGPTGSGEQGAECAGAEQCAAGLYCSSGGRCEPLCKVGTDDCGSGTRCFGAETPLVAAGREIGACACRPPPGAVCDMGVDCGCNAGETCGFLDASIGCRPLSRDAAPPQALCSTDADCPAAHSCLGNVCQKQCLAPEDCGWTGAECSPVPDGTGQFLPGFNICRRACDPTSPQAPSEGRQPCVLGAHCVPFEAGLLCVAAGGGLDGSACLSFSDCAPGSFCSAKGICQSWCEVGSDDCGAGRSCRGYDPPVLSDPPGLSTTELGGCVCEPSNGNECDPRNDCGCESGGTCDFFSNPPRFACRALADAPLAPHEACSDESSCPALHSCIHGVCKRLCVGSEDCSSPGSRCQPVSDEPSLEGYDFCTISCDPISPATPRSGFEACSAGVQCVAATLGADCFATAGTANEGDSCANLAECAPGLLCGLGGVCQAYCEVGTSTCEPGLSCQGFDFLLRSAGRDFGRCVCAATGGSDCDLASDCGCDPGTSCAIQPPLTQPPSTLCLAVPTSPVEPYALCASDAVCPALHSCTRGVCEQRCFDASECPGGDCVAVVDGEGQAIAGFNICTRNCDPVSPASPRAGLQPCGAGAQCFATETLTDCARAGAAGLSELCNDFSDCLPGLFCGGSGECQAWCNVADGACPGAGVCTSFVPPVTIGENEWGACVGP